MLALLTIQYFRVSVVECWIGWLKINVVLLTSVYIRLHVHTGTMKNM